MKYLTLLLTAIVVLVCNTTVRAIEQLEPSLQVPEVPVAVLAKIDAKAAAVNRKLIENTGLYLRRMAREEGKLQKKLSGKHKEAAIRIFGEATSHYTLLEKKVAKLSNLATNASAIYLPVLDTLQTAVKFLNQATSLASPESRQSALINSAADNMNLLNNRLAVTEEIESFMRQRRAFLQQRLGDYGMLKELRRLHKQVFYYQARVKALKQQLNDPALLQAKAMAMIMNSASFKSFFKQHSQLNSLFRVPGSSAATDAELTPGLQTVANVEQQLIQRFGSLPGFQQTVILPSTGPKTMIADVKSQVQALVSTNSNAEMPGFTPNSQKMKPFAKRLEYGANLQTAKGNRFFPSTTDIALSVGYKANDKLVFGIGGSYKMGLGKSLRQVAISHQGIGLRSFIDVKFKQGFYLTGGAELDYRSGFEKFPVLQDLSPWQKRALLGISKKYLVSKTLKGNLQLLYDFLYRSQIPRTSPVVFRIGYLLK